MTSFGFGQLLRCTLSLYGGLFLTQRPFLYSPISELRFEYFIKKKFLASLAYNEFFRKGLLEIPVVNYNTVLEEYAHRYNWTPEVTENFGLDLARSGILTIKDSVTYRHRTFLDYFVAWYIKEDATDVVSSYDLIAHAHFDETWNDTAFFFVGLKREIPSALYTKIDQEYSKLVGIRARIGRIMVGRLLQAGWLSESGLKYDGIRKALEVLSETRQLFLDELNKDKREVPRIVGDYLIFSTMSMAFGSGFLLDESRRLLEEVTISDKDEVDEVFGAIAILWSVQKQIDQSSRKSYVESLLKKLSRLAGRSQEKVLSREDEIRMLLFLQLIETGDRDLKSGIENKLKRVIRNSREIVKQLLPSKPSRVQAKRG